MRSALLKKLTICGLLAALVLVFTMFTKIPIPFTSEGYVHIGDSVIYFASFIVGGWAAAAVAAIGSMLADWLVGAGAYMIPTFIIKGLMALVAAAGFGFFKKNTLGQLLSMTLAGLVMVAGYFAAEWLMFSIGYAVAALPFNFIQMVAGIVIALPIIRFFKDKKFFLIG
jgi:uncharacterized membrane protein